MDWGVGPSERERFAHALLTFMFFAPADAALAALGPGRIFSGTETFRGIALCVIRGRSGVLARSRAPDPPQRAPDIDRGAMESAPQPSAAGRLTWHSVAISR
jgi:hypothetical protein